MSAIFLCTSLIFVDCLINCHDVYFHIEQALQLLQKAKKNTMQVVSRQRVNPRAINMRKIFKDDRYRDDEDDETDEIADLEKRIT